MNTLWLLFRDELNGFYKSGVMIALWIFLPLLGILMYFLLGDKSLPMGPPSPDGSPMPQFTLPASTFIGLIVSNIGAQITSLVLTVGIINEKTKNVYDIFVIRPIRRSHLLWAKFFAVFLCVGLACILALVAGVLLDTFRGLPFTGRMFETQLENFVMSLGIVGVMSAVGILFGVMTDSIIVGVILILFLGGFVIYFPTLPPLLGLPNSTLWSLLLGGGATVGLMALASLLFKNRQF